MGKKKRSKSGKDSINMARVTTVSGRVLLSLNVPNTGQVSPATNLTDTIAVNLGEMGDMFGLFRFTRLRVKCYPVLTGNYTASATPTLFGMAFTPETVLVAPTTLAECLQFPYCVMFNSAYGNSGNSGMTVPQTFTVPWKALTHTGAKWFRTQGASSVDDFDSQGSFFGFTLSTPDQTAGVRAMLEYTAEFCDPLPIGVTLNKLRTLALETPPGGETSDTQKRAESVGSGKDRYGAFDQVAECERSGRSLPELTAAGKGPAVPVIAQGRPAMLVWSDH